MEALRFCDAPSDFEEREENTCFVSVSKVSERLTKLGLTILNMNKVHTTFYILIPQFLSTMLKYISLTQ